MAEFEQSLALIIGINAYGNCVPPLDTARNDATRLAEILQQDHGYETLLLLDEQATLSGLRAVLLEELPERLGPDDRLLFYFAGHGIAVDSDGGPNGYLLPQDAILGREDSYLHMPSLHDALCRLDCRHLLVILDSCFGGAFRWSSSRTILTLPDVIHKERYERFTTDPAWQVLTSASHDETAADQLVGGSLGSRGTADNNAAHSPFAQALFDGLQGDADVVPSDGRDGVITASELYVYINERVSRELEEQRKLQTPRLWPLERHDNGEFIFLVPGHDLNLPDAPEPDYDNNPYKGLRSYDQEDQALFFGRSEAIAELREHMESHPLTVTVGASGTGKSSLVKAGLLSRLEDGWLVLPVVRPGANPKLNLQRAIATGLGMHLNADLADIRRCIDHWCSERSDTRLALCIDQFEELFTMTRADKVREEVQRFLAALIRDHPRQFRLVITVRLDFAPLFREGPLGEEWEDAKYVIPAMTQDELRDVIIKPASEMVLIFDPPDLVDDLINEVIATPGALPLLSFALSEMYRSFVDRKSKERAISTLDYEAVGGVIGSLRTRADTIYEAFQEDMQATMRRVILRMVATEGGNSYARRRVYLDELVFPEKEENARVTRVISALTEARMIVKDQEEDDESYIEPAHDALVRGWDKLISWLNKINQRQVARLRYLQTLNSVADEWEGAEHKIARELLWSDPARATLLKQALKEEGGWLNAREERFAQKSIRKRKRTRRNRFIMVISMILTTIVAFISALVAGYQMLEAEAATAQAEQATTEAINERDRAAASIFAMRSGRELEAHRRERALLYAVQAYAMSGLTEPLGALTRVLQEVRRYELEAGTTFRPELAGQKILKSWSKVDQARFGLDPERVFLASHCDTGDNDQCANNQRYVSLMIPGETGVAAAWKMSVTFEPDDIIFNSENEFLVLSNATESALIKFTTEGGFTSELYSLPLTRPQLAVKADTLAGINSAGDIELWNIQRLEFIGEFTPMGPIDVYAIDPDALHLVVAGVNPDSEMGELNPHYLQSVDLAKNELESERVGWEKFQTLEYSPDGNWLVASGRQNWDYAVGAEYNRSPDLVNVSWWNTDDAPNFDNVANRVWDAVSPVISPDSKVLAVAPDSGPMSQIHLFQPLWDLNTGKSIHVAAPEINPPTEFSFSPDSKLVIGYDPKTTNTDLVILESHTGVVAHIDSGIAPNLKSVKFGNFNWDLWLEQGDSYQNFLLAEYNWTGMPLFAVENSVGLDTYEQHFLGESDGILTLSAQGRVQLWDREGNWVKSLFEDGMAFYSITTSADGKLIALTQDTSIHVYEMSNQTPTLRWRTPETETSVRYYNISFSPDGKHLAYTLDPVDAQNRATIVDTERGDPLPETQPLENAQLVYYQAQGKTGLVAWFDTEPNGSVALYNEKLELESDVYEINGEIVDVAVLASDDDPDPVIAVANKMGVVEFIRPIAGFHEFDALTGYRINEIKDLAFNPSNGLLAVVADQVDLWEIRSMQRVARGIQQGESAGRNSVTFSADGNAMLIGLDEMVTLWDMNPENWVDLACSMVDRNLSLMEWQNATEDLDYRCTCEDLPPPDDYPEDRCLNAAGTEWLDATDEEWVQ